MANYSDAIKSLSDGAVGVIPTDTVYGLVCKAGDEAAVARMYTLKNKQKNPGTVIAANIEDLVQLGIKARYLKAVEHYWPNPISIIIPTSELAYIHLGMGGVAVRIPADSELHKFLEQTGPLLTSSANQPNKPVATTSKQAREFFADTVDFYIDGGDLSGRKPSTILRIIDDAVDVVRQGTITIDDSGEILY